jgi:pSer/pThr/pTyr-binding forkhead associated (FHA) protein
MTVQFQFVMRSGPTPGKIFPLEGPEIIIGRDNTSSLMVNDAEVSRKHTRLIRQSLGYVIEDLGSTNGTFVNGQRLSTPFVLRGGESVSLGENIVLVYESTADPNATMLSASASAVKMAVAETQTVAEVSNPEPPLATATFSEQAPAPARPASSGQVPAGPAPSQPAAAKKSNKKMIIFLVVVLGLLCICCVIAIFLYRAPITFWCNNLSFIFKPELYPQCIP